MESKWRNFVLAPSFSVWKASREILYMCLLLVFGKQVERFCTRTFFWGVKASGEILYTRLHLACGKQVEKFLYTCLLLVFEKHGEKFCTFGEDLYIFECDQSLLEKRVYLNHFFCGFRRLTLFLSVSESHFKYMKMHKLLTKWNTWIQAHWNDTQILETSLTFYCTTTIIWLMLGNDTQILETFTCSMCVLPHMIFIWLMFVNKW